MGVFVVVGIAGAAILLGAGFLFFRRRRRQKLDRDVAAAAAAANAAARTPFDDDEDASGGHTSYTSNSGPAMTQYGGYYATGPGSYDYESAGGYDPYAAAAAGAVGSTVGGAAAGGAAAAGAGGRDHNRNSFIANPATDHGDHLASGAPLPVGGYPAGNESQYYLDPQEYDYDKTPENERYMDEPGFPSAAAMAGGQHHPGMGMGYAEPYYPAAGEQHAYGGQSGMHEPMHGHGHEDEVDYNGRRGLRIANPSDE